MADKRGKEKPNGFIDKVLNLFGIKRPKSENNEPLSYNGRITEDLFGKDKAADQSQVQDENFDSGFKVNLDDNYEEPETEEDPYLIKNKEDYFSDSSHKQINPYSENTQEKGPVIGDDFEIISSPVPNNKKMKKKKKRTVGRNIGRAIVAAMLVMIIAICLIIGSFMVYVFAAVDGTLDNDLNNLKLAYTSIVYATDKKTGKDIELTRLHGEENRLWVDLKDVPKNLKYAFVSAEDKRFYQHDGVDWKRTFSAFANLFVHIYVRALHNSWLKTLLAMMNEVLCVRFRRLCAHAM
ncbi:MAG: transglycosylase domain-containing protein [Eubacterium sp.]